MSRKIDHDEADRDSSEYEICDEEEEDDVEKTPPEQFIYQSVAQQVPDHQQPTTSSHVAMEEVPVSMNIEYEEVYPQQVVQTHDAGKVYYENEMEDLVYHEIYGDGNEQQKLGHEKRIRNLLGTSVSCLICQRTESEKIRLFKWPKSPDLREQWLHFFRIPSNTLSALVDPYICCYHFSADTFVMMEDRIFWKMTALPKYRQRRPGLSEPFPWEPAAKMKLDQQILNSQATAESMGYKIRYRMPYNKHKTRRVHQVAVMIPIAQPHLYYEFHFNRPGLHNTKFYACLNCRKAKTESNIRDVIRTIHLDGHKFLSSGDPFTGHHFACRPHNIYDYKSSWRPIPGQNGEGHFLDEVVYVDESGNSLEWDTVTRPGDEEEQGPERSKEPSVELFETFEEEPEPICDRVVETGEKYEMKESQEDAPTLDNMEGVQEDVGEDDDVKSGKNSQKTKIKCHLCLKSDFPSTKMFISHLQKHISQEKRCKKCSQKISCDSRPVCIRRGTCERCFSN